MNENNS
jgi:hypothetical protein